MIVASFFIPLELPTFNELEAARGKVAAARGTGDSTRQNAYNALKRKAQHDCAVHFLSQRGRNSILPRLPWPLAGGPFVVELNWRTRDARTDPDNIAAGKKILLDALSVTRADSVGAGVLHCDGHHCIAGFRDSFVTGADPASRGVQIFIENGD